MLLLDTLLNIIFPVTCVGCGHRDLDFCDACITKSPANDRETLPWIYATFDYRHPPIKKALWLLKYKGRKRLARTFAESIYGNILEELSDLSQMENFRNAILIPIPLSKTRGRERGYNQAELVASELVRLDGEKNFSLEKRALMKIKDTKRQAHIENRRQRLRNIEGSFAVSLEYADQIRHKNVILLDDITTTGATLSEARKVLKKSGAKKVIAFTVAH